MAALYYVKIGQCHYSGHMTSLATMNTLTLIGYCERLVCVTENLISSCERAGFNWSENWKIQNTPTC